jgi:hypothetical protein
MVQYADEVVALMRQVGWDRWQWVLAMVRRRHRVLRSGSAGPPKKPLRSSELRAAFPCSPKPPRPPGKKKELKMPRHI